MRCEQVVDLFSAYLDQQATAEEAGEVERHIATCAACARDLADLRRTIELCRSVGEVEMPEGFHEDLMRKIQQKQVRQGLLARLGFDRLRQPYKAMVAVAAVIVISFGITTVANWSPRMGSPAPAGQLASRYGTRDEGAVRNDQIPAEEQAKAAAPPGMGGGADAYSRQAAQPQMKMALKAPEAGMAMPQIPPAPVEPDLGIVETLDRKLIKRADLQIEVAKDKMDETGRKVVTVVEMAKGFVQSSSMFTDEGKYRGLSFSLRVPEEKFGAILGELEVLGKVVSKQITSEDVTEQFIDTEAQLRNKERQEQRLLEIMGKANNVGELMQVENELNRVRSEVDMLKGRMKYLQGATSYSTITMTVREPRDDVSTGPLLPGFADEVWRAFMRTFKGMAIFLARIAPYAILLSVAWLVYSRMSRGKQPSS
ncbi:MAG: DUF4349 domain-containing protein [Ignavibacteriales bacterium]